MAGVTRRGWQSRTRPQLENETRPKPGCNPITPAIYFFTGNSNPTEIQPQIGPQQKKCSHGNSRAREKKRKTMSNAQGKWKGAEMVWIEIWWTHTQKIVTSTNTPGSRQQSQWTDLKILWKKSEIRLEIVNAASWETLKLNLPEVTLSGLMHSISGIYKKTITAFETGFRGRVFERRECRKRTTKKICVTTPKFDKAMIIVKKLLQLKYGPALKLDRKTAQMLHNLA